jgi:DNA-binding NarL/FixJ family response regulator
MIADRLELSVVTICHHLKHVFEKMHVSSRTEAAIRYLNLQNPTD